MIVTTIQKMQILISKRLKEGTAEYNRLRGLKTSFCGGMSVTELYLRLPRE